MGTFAFLIALAAVAIPIIVVAKVVRRVKQVTSRLSDPTRLQRAFAESAAAALRRAGADPKAVAKLEVLGMGEPSRHGTIDLRAAVREARAALPAAAPAREAPRAALLPRGAPTPTQARPPRH